MYEGDAPLAERRAAALTLDRDLLRELLGSEELRELLDPRALDEVEAELQRLGEGRGARSSIICTTSSARSATSPWTASVAAWRAATRRRWSSSSG